jgi:multidrug efflux pump subunit AcrB
LNQSPKNKKPVFSAFTINIVFIVFIILGLSLIKYIPVKLNPGKLLPVVYINFNYYGATPEIVEKQVTSKLEGVFETIKGIENVKSFSGEGWGQIQLNLDDEVNAQMVRFEVLSLIREVYPELPNEVTFPRLTQAGANTEDQVQLLTYTINGNVDSYILYKYLNNNIQPKLAQIDGVQKITTYGSTPYQWEIRYYSNRLREFDISKAEIKKAINNYYSQTDLGFGMYSDASNTDELILMTALKGEDKNGANLAKIPIKKVSDRIIYLGEIAHITHIQKKQQSFYRINGLTAVNMVIYATTESNQISLAKEIKNEMLIIQGKLPPGYSITVSYDASLFLEQEIQKTFWRTIASIVVLLIFVLIVSRNFRYFLIIVLSLIANLSIAIFFYYILKIEIHLYSLAGITVSLGVLIDNSIIMTDHIRHKNNKKVFLAVLAATLTTIGALVVIFFLEKEQQVNLVDFAWVIIINLSVSTAIALFFIPAVMEKIPLTKKGGTYFFRRKKRVVRFNNLYRRFILFGVKYRLVTLIVGLLAFGLPFYMLPAKMAGDKWYIKLYNNTFGNEKYTESLKPVLDKTLGGTLRLFTEFVREDIYVVPPQQRTTLNVRVKIPQGASMEHLDAIYIDFENYLSQFEEIDFYQTDINSIENSNLVIYFKKDFEDSSFPYLLKGRLESKAIDISSADFSIYGVGIGFSNALFKGFKDSRLVLSGYNYDELLKLARDAKNELIKNPRISEVFMVTGNSWWFTEVQNSYILIDKKYLARAKIPINELVKELNAYNLRSEYMFDIPFGGEFEEVNLFSDRASESDLWIIMQTPIDLEKSIKLKDISEFYKEEASKIIYRENQEYKLTMAYNFIGPSKLSQVVLEKHEKEINSKMPIGYKAVIPISSFWNVKEKKQYLLLFLILVIIYFICAILLESIIQPFLVIAMIPLSFIGIFLTFYLFEFKFDQGGYASFLLVSGLVVNSALYIINDFNNYDITKHNIARINKYIKAYSFKIIPIIITIISTILGLVPFIFWGNKETFWFALAVGTIGGLLFSFPVIIVFLPLMLKNITINKVKSNG